ncbi:MAG: arginine decarboxylase, pyruvoyl-dependent [Candidatus Woesebacteria bacterium]|nr:arginine decarboxylase, pyruvoyl-dependent [Candidatus Woesebacteria bacterium]
MNLIPNKVFFVRGVGRHREKLVSFEMALRSAGIHFLNYVQVSSIFPPNAELISKEEGSKLIKPGQISFIVMSRTETDEPHRLISASVGLALPSDKNQYGYLSEHHASGLTDEECGDYAEDLSAMMLSTIIGVDFDINASYDERQETWKVSDKIVKTMNTTQSAIGQRNLWTTVISAAVLLLEEN